jgi:hypothetical protein
MVLLTKTYTELMVDKNETKPLLTTRNLWHLFAINQTFHFYSGNAVLRDSGTAIFNLRCKQCKSSCSLQNEYASSYLDNTVTRIQGRI